jgi:hypothetical protein
MKRIVLLTTLATMMAAALALSGVAQAKPIGGSNKANSQCLAEAVRTLQPGFKIADYAFHGGTEGNDDFTGSAPAGPDVFCGFGGNDRTSSTIDEGDIFLGGAGNDYVYANVGTFYGQEGDDFVGNNLGTFYGGAGNDGVFQNIGGTFVQD